MIVLIAFTSALFAWLLSRALAAGRGIVILDHPNERSLHTQPKPRTGGLAIVAAIVVGHLALFLTGRYAPQLAISLGAAAVFGISVAEDFRHRPAALRILVHLLAAAALVALGPRVATLTLPGLIVSMPAPLAAVVTVLFVTWLTNLYNFMDGMDGFAGGMGVLGFAGYALLAWRAGAAEMAASSLVIAASCAGFLGHNFPPARIFMGDAGSSVLGFLAGALAVYADAAGHFPLWISVLVFSPFIVDATVTLLRRAGQGHAVWRAHRTHYYQRLVAAGWSHRQTTLWEYALMLCCGLAALLMVDAPEARQVTLIWGSVLVYAMLIVCVRRIERRQDV